MARLWYILHTYSGYENKIERTIRTLIERGTIQSGIICDIKIPEEAVVENKDGKKKNIKRKFLPGYMLVEMDLPDTGWKRVCAEIKAIQGVGGFLGASGNNRPQSISMEEAREILQKSGDIKSDKASKVLQSFSIGQQVRITDGPFTTFSGAVDEVMVDKNKLRVLVAVFGRATPVEVEMSQVETI